MSLTDKRCVPARAAFQSSRRSACRSFSKKYPGWEAPQGHHLHRVFSFPDFKQGLDFVNRAGEIAEQEGHHPDLLLAWGRVEVTVFTHSIDGLSENDFVLAAKIGQLYANSFIHTRRENTQHAWSRRYFSAIQSGRDGLDRSEDGVQDHHRTRTTKASGRFTSSGRRISLSSARPRSPHSAS